MDHKNSNKALAVTLSIFFHAAFVCTAAFLPLYLSQQDPKNVNELEVAVIGEGVAPETGAPAQEEQDMVAAPAPAPAAAPMPAPEAKAEVTVTHTVVAAAKKPVEAIKEAPKKKPVPPAPTRVMMAKQTPTAEQQVEEESQPAIEVGDSLNEDGVNTIEPAQEAAPVAAASVKEEAPAQQASAQGQGGASDKPAATVAAPQNFLTLKQAQGNRPPTYPRDARLQKAEGKGQLAYYVSKVGKVTDIKVNKSSGVPALDQAALEAFAKYKFVPGQEGYTLHNFEFTLQGPAEQDGARLRTSYQEKSEPSRPASLR